MESCLVGFIMPMVRAEKGVPVHKSTSLTGHCIRFLDFHDQEPQIGGLRENRTLFPHNSGG
jgi:hypothetical protein